MENFDLYTDAWLPVVLKGERTTASIKDVFDHKDDCFLDVSNQMTYSAVIDLLAAIGSAEDAKTLHDDGYFRLFGDKAFYQDNDMPLQQAQDITYLDITSSNYKSSVLDDRFGDTEGSVDYAEAALMLVRAVRYPLAVRMRISKDDYFTVADSRAKTPPNLSRVIVYPDWSRSIGDIVQKMDVQGELKHVNLTYDEDAPIRPVKSMRDALTFPARRIKLVPSQDGLVHQAVLSAGITPNDDTKFDAAPFAVFTEKGDKHTQIGERTESQLIASVVPQIVSTAQRLGYRGQYVTAFDLYADQGRALRDGATYRVYSPEQDVDTSAVVNDLDVVKNIMWTVQRLYSPHQGYEHDDNIMSSWMGDRLYDLVNTYLKTGDTVSMTEAIIHECMDALSMCALPNRQIYFLENLNDYLVKSSLSDDDAQQVLAHINAQYDFPDASDSDDQSALESVV